MRDSTVHFSMETDSCHKNYSARQAERWAFSFHLSALRDSGSRHLRSKRYLVLCDFRARALVGDSEEKKETLHAAGLLLSAKSAVQFAQRAAVNSRRVPLRLSDTWLD